MNTRDISGQHAVLTWTGQHWELQDLGSRNGTFLDDEPVVVGSRRIVLLGSHIRFGRKETWVVADVSPPTLMVVRTDTGEICVAEGGLLTIPDTHSPPACIYQDPQGAWVCERRGEPVILADRAVLTVEGVAWVAHLPLASHATAQSEVGPALVAGLRLRLVFSRDEEHVEVVAFAGERRFDLKARAHNYLLLVLARRRIADTSADIPYAEQGWIDQDELLQMLRMSENHLNISVYRARKELSRAGVADAASIIERRSGIRQLRLGVRELELVPLDEPRDEPAPRPRQPRP